MNKLVFLTFFGVCCLLVAKGNDEFHGEWKKYMDDKYCSEDASQESKNHYLKCCEMFSKGIKDVMYEKTNKTDMAGAMDVLCLDENVLEQLCNELKEKKEELKMSEEEIEKMKECKNGH